MPVSNDFLKNLLPYAQGNFAPQAATGLPLGPVPAPGSDPLAGGMSLPPPGAPPEALASVPPPIEPPPQSPAYQTGFKPPEPPPASQMPGNQLDEGAVRAGLEAAAARQAPPAPVAPNAPTGPGPAQPAGLPSLIPVRSGGTAAHEVDVAGDRQKSLIEGATDTRVKGTRTAQDLQIEAENEKIRAAQHGYDMADAAAAGARVRQANEAARLDDQQKEIDAAVANRAVTPIKDYFADKSTGNKLLMGLALAIGGFGAGKTGSGNNPAMTMLQADMDRDLKTKEMRSRQESTEKQGKIDAAQQGFNNLVKQGGLAYARDAEAAAQQRMIGSQAQILAAKTAIPEIKARAEQIQAETVAKSKEYQAQAMIKFVPKTGGGVSFFDRKTGLPLTQQQAFKLQSEREARGEEQAGKIDVANIAAQKGQKTSNDENRRFIGSQTQQAKIPEAVAVIDSAKKLAAAAGNDGIGLAAQTLWKASPVLYEKRYGPAAAAREQAFQAVANLDINRISGGNVSPTEDVRNKAKLYGARTAAARAQALEAFEAPVNLAQKNILAAAGPEAAAEYQNNQAALAPPPIAFTPQK